MKIQEFLRTPRKFNSSPQKNDGTGRQAFLLGPGNFSGEKSLLNFRRIDAFTSCLWKVLQYSYSIELRGNMWTKTSAFTICLPPWTKESFILTSIYIQHNYCILAIFYAKTSVRGTKSSQLLVSYILNTWKNNPWHFFFKPKRVGCSLPTKYHSFAQVWKKSSYSKTPNSRC